jgi:hypothetical protein
MSDRHSVGYRSRGSGRPTRGLVAAGAVLGLLLAPLAAASASAASDSVTIKFVKTSITVEYGQDWHTDLRLTGAYRCQYLSCAHVISIVEEGNPTPLTTSPLPMYSADSSSLGGSSLPTPLAVGKHTLSGLFKRYDVTGRSSVPLTVTVTPTSLTSAVRIVPDPNHVGNAVISATLSGKYIQALLQQRPGEVFPAGTWQVAVTDTAGKKLFTKTVDQKAGGEPFLSVYWNSEPAGGGSWSATAAFTPDSASAGNFTITPAKPSTITVLDSSPLVVSSPTPAPIASGTTLATGPSLPTWLLVIGGIIVVILVIALMLLSVALRRSVSRSAEPSGGTQ